MNFEYKPEMTDRNVYYMFQRLLTPIFISTLYMPYKSFWGEFNEMLKIVKNWMAEYFNTKSFESVNAESLNSFDSLLTDLKFNCLEIDTQYIEEIDIWHGEFLLILKDYKSQKKKEIG